MHHFPAKLLQLAYGRYKNYDLNYELEGECFQDIHVSLCTYIYHIYYDFVQHVNISRTHLKEKNMEKLAETEDEV